MLTKSFVPPSRPPPLGEGDEQSSPLLGKEVSNQDLTGRLSAINIMQNKVKSYISLIFFAVFIYFLSKYIHLLVPKLPLGNPVEKLQLLVTC